MPTRTRTSTKRPSDATLIKRLATLNPAQARVYQLLLTDRSEAEIARALRRPFNTVHSQAKTIFQKLGVRSRYGLLLHVLDQSKIKRLTSLLTQRGRQT
jgi:DNA-binding NarL/FixJ family response regulator